MCIYFILTCFDILQVVSGRWIESSVATYSWILCSVYRWRSLLSLVFSIELTGVEEFFMEHSMQRSSPASPSLLEQNVLMEQITKKWQIILAYLLTDYCCSFLSDYQHYERLCMNELMIPGQLSCFLYLSFWFTTARTNVFIYDLNMNRATRSICRSRPTGLQLTLWTAVPYPLSGNRLLQHNLPWGSLRQFIDSTIAKASPPRVAGVLTLIPLCFSQYFVYLLVSVISEERD